LTFARECAARGEPDPQKQAEMSVFARSARPDSLSATKKN